MIEQPQTPTLPIHGVMPRFSSVLSLFDGMSCGQIALNRVGIEYDNYFASEIDKHAIKVTQANYPKTIQLGDVTKIKVKTLCLSEVYSYICNYDNNLQSKISEWEMLYWFDKKFTLSAKVGTQKSNEGQKVQQFTALQCVEEIRFSNNSLGSIIKSENDRGSRKNGDENDFGKSFKLQRSCWWYDYEFYPRDLQENIRKSKRNTENGCAKKENIRNIKEEVFKQERARFNIQTHEESDVDTRSEGELFEKSRENRLQREVKKEKRYRGKEKVNSIEEISRELQEWDETNGIEDNYWGILRLHKEEQVTVVEYEGGFHVFKGVIDLCIGGSPCQGFSFAGKGLNFEDPRSKLFFEFVRLKNETQPKYFLLENVVMKKEHEKVISEFLGVEPILINSNLVSAQNRKRLYWTNIPDIKQPADKQIGWGKIREFGVADNFYYSENGLSWLKRHGERKGKKLSIWGENDKCQMIEASHFKNYSSQRFFGIEDEKGLRYITPIECERAQTIPDNYTDCVSNTQRYKMIGNGWTVDVIAHIFGSLLNGA